VVWYGKGVLRYAVGDTAYWWVRQEEGKREEGGTLREGGREGGGGGVGRPEQCALCVVCASVGGRIKEREGLGGWGEGRPLTLAASGWRVTGFQIRSDLDKIIPQPLRFPLFILSGIQVRLRPHSATTQVFKLPKGLLALPMPAARGDLSPWSLCPGHSPAKGPVQGLMLASSLAAGHMRWTWEGRKTPRDEGGEGDK
jgi:hypothetical protein